MPKISIDDEVFAALQANAEPFVDTPNSVLRRMLDLDDGEDLAPDLVPIHVRTPESDIESNKQSGGFNGSESRTGIEKRKYSRASSGDLLPQHDYFDPILQILFELGGTGRSREVINRIPKKIGHLFQRLDHEPTAHGDVRWRNRAQWARNSLVEQGLLAADSPRGVWKLTDAGRRRAA